MIAGAFAPKQAAPTSSSRRATASAWLMGFGPISICRAQRSVSAFAGLERMKAAYGHAIAQGYRFYSYGDASLLWRA
jgi:hypothetical protein